MNKLKQLTATHVFSIFCGLFLLISGLFFYFINKTLESIKVIHSQLEQPVNNLKIVLIIFILTILLICMLFIFILRKIVVNFSKNVGQAIDGIINGKDEIIFQDTKDTLLSKISSKLKHLNDTIGNQRTRYVAEKEQIQTLISDISHQIKTPLANISMYNETLIHRQLSDEMRSKFLNNMQWQISKLQWLIESLINMSRLETGIIELNVAEENINTTLAKALSGVYVKAEEKNIKVKVQCSKNIKLVHDRKWTTEALFNILDNAVKYTELGGEIEITVDKWELFTKIDIKDNGIGIAEDELHNIFKRFYRVAEVSDVEGVGIGLYLANEIVTKQGGYMKVASKKGEGSTFSVFLKN